MRIVFLIFQRNYLILLAVSYYQKIIHNLLLTLLLSSNVFLKYKFEKNIFIDGGVQVGLFYKGTDLFHNTIENKDDLSYKNDIRTQFKRLDAGVSAGVGYKFKKGLGLNIGARYYYGMVNIYKGGSKTNNSYFYFYADIPIGAKKAKKTQEPTNDN